MSLKAWGERRFYNTRTRHDSVHHYQMNTQYFGLFHCFKHLAIIQGVSHRATIPNMGLIGPCSPGCEAASSILSVSCAADARPGDTIRAEST